MNMNTELIRAFLDDLLNKSKDGLIEWHCLSQIMNDSNLNMYDINEINNEIAFYEEDFSHVLPYGSFGCIYNNGIIIIAQTSNDQYEMYYNNFSHNKIYLLIKPFSSNPCKLYNVQLNRELTEKMYYALEAAKDATPGFQIAIELDRDREVSKFMADALANSFQVENPPARQS